VSALRQRGCGMDPGWLTPGAGPPVRDVWTAGWARGGIPIYENRTVAKVEKSVRGKAEWAAYAVGVPSTRPDWSNLDCAPFDTVFHICHVAEAFRVFEDARIRSSLVWDESRLRNTRTCVSWVSPNHWFSGSIYGNIRFDFDWKEVVQGKSLFWVEAISRYSPPAYRILVSDTDHVEAGLKRYDPKRRDGPLFYDRAGDTWYRNGHFTGEILIDADLWLSECKRAGFVDHHPRNCRRMGSQCPDLGKKASRAGAELIARLVGHSILEPQEVFLDASAKRRRLHREAAESWAHLAESLKVTKGSSGTVSHRHPAAQFLAASILDRIGLGRPKGTRKLCDLFSSTKELKLALTRRMVRALGLPSAEGLEED
jgi:hypothetical protein